MFSLYYCEEIKTDNTICRRACSSYHDNGYTIQRHKNNPQNMHLHRNHCHQSTTLLLTIFLIVLMCGVPMLYDGCEHGVYELLTVVQQDGLTPHDTLLYGHDHVRVRPASKPYTQQVSSFLLNNLIVFFLRALSYLSIMPYV